MNVAAINNLNITDTYLNSDELSFAIKVLQSSFALAVTSDFLYQKLRDDWNDARKYITPITEGLWQTVEGYTPRIDSRILLIPAITSTSTYPRARLDHWIAIARFAKMQHETHEWDFYVVDSSNLTHTFEEARTLITSKSTLHVDRIQLEQSNISTHTTSSKWHYVQSVASG